MSTVSNASTPTSDVVASLPTNNPATTVPQSPPKTKHLIIHLFAGGVAGFCEALTCHPLDTIKVRLQLRTGSRSANPVAGSSSALLSDALKPKRPPNFITIGRQIVQKEGVLALYKGLGAVVSGIVPKMAIRFSSFEYFKGKLADPKTGATAGSGILLAGIAAGATESVLIVTPMDVIKIRLQAQRHSMSDPLDIPKYRNAAHCAYVMAMEEGIGSLYKGVWLTVLRQSSNQGTNFFVYQALKQYIHERQPHLTSLPWYQPLFMGLVSGACGPLVNAPIDTIKTRIQKSPSQEKGWRRFVNVTQDIYKNEGFRAFYRGLTPRVLRVAPGQAITFMVYEKVYKWMVDLTIHDGSTAKDEPEVELLEIRDE